MLALLLLCVAVSSALLASNLVLLGCAEENVIELVASNAQGTGSDDEEGEGASSSSGDAASSQDGDGAAASGGTAGGVYFTDTNIFRVTYDGDGGTVAVLGDGGDKLIAPGTKNSCTFSLKNSTSSTVEYTMDVKAYLAPDSFESVPITARLANAQGYLTADDGEWVYVLDLDGIQDAQTLGAKASAQYTLDWEWPFETGDDAYDTALGDRAVNDELTLTIAVTTTASVLNDNSAGTNPGADPNTNTDTDTDIFSKLSQTGDELGILLCGMAAVAVVAVFVLVCLLMRRRKEKGEDA